MSDSFLDRFLDKGLLDLKGNDEWYGHITLTAQSLSAYLRANPEEIVPFTYAALLPDVGDNDPATEKTLGLLKAEWKTYASVSMASPKAMLRAIILDALLANAESDDATKSALALLLASALPHLSVGKEKEVWKTVLDDLLCAVDRKAEVAWTVPSRISVPAFTKINMPKIRFSVKGGEFDEHALEKGMYAAAGPSNVQNQPTSGNPHWSNQGQSWSYEFVPLAVSAISGAISAATDTKTVSANTGVLAKALTGAIVNYLESFVGQIASTTHGVEMRARLLWWKERRSCRPRRVSATATSIAKPRLDSWLTTIRLCCRPSHQQVFGRSCLRLCERCSPITKRHRWSNGCKPWRWSRMLKHLGKRSVKSRLQMGIDPWCRS